jgi:PKD repeat protein
MKMRIYKLSLLSLIVGTVFLMAISNPRSLARRSSNHYIELKSPQTTVLSSKGKGQLAKTHLQCDYEFGDTLTYYWQGFINAEEAVLNDSMAALDSWITITPTFQRTAAGDTEWFLIQVERDCLPPGEYVGTIYNVWWWDDDPEDIREAYYTVCMNQPDSNGDGIGDACQACTVRVENANGAPGDTDVKVYVSLDCNVPTTMLNCVISETPDPNNYLRPTDMQPTGRATTITAWAFGEYAYNETHMMIGTFLYEPMPAGTGPVMEVDYEIDSQAQAGIYVTSLSDVEVTGDSGQFIPVVTENGEFAVEGGNEPPIAILWVAPQSGDAPLVVHFDGSESEDPDGELVSYEWDTNGDEVFDITTEVGTAEFTYESMGIFPVTLRVTDNHGATGTATKSVYVGEVPHSVTIADTQECEIQAETEERCGIDITTCPASWMPEGRGPGSNVGDPGNSVDFTAKIYRWVPGTGWVYPGPPAKITFTLSGVSSEKGVCLNFGTETDKDLKFRKTATVNTDFDPPAADGQSITTTNPVTTATVTVTCYDWGAWGNIKATAGGCELIPPNGPVQIPIDVNSNQCADAWWQGDNVLGNGAADDPDNEPAGQEEDGDGLSRYEEYRGLKLGSSHFRFFPRFKEVFIYDEDHIWDGYFPSSNLSRYWIIDPSEMNGTGSAGAGHRWITFNGGHARVHNDAQHALWLRDNNVDGVGSWGKTDGDPNDAAPIGPPITALSCRIDISQIETDFAGASPAGMTKLKSRTIAHELGHGLDVVHHTPNRGGGNLCIMRSINRVAVQTAIANGDVDINTYDIGSSYCNAGDNCYHQIDVSDPR